MPGAGKARRTDETSGMRSGASLAAATNPQERTKPPTVAFEDEYRRLFPSVVEYCRRLLQGGGDPEAVAQEAFARAWATPDRFRGARFDAWVSTIARRLCISAHRHGAVVEANASAVMAATRPWSAPVAEIVEAREDERMALEALRRLKPGYRRLVALRDLNGWSYEEIAAAEHSTVESVRARLRRARVSLRHAYADISSSGPRLVVLGWFRRLRERRGRRSAVLERSVAPWMHVLSSYDVLVALVATAGIVAALPGPVSMQPWEVPPVAAVPGEGAASAPSPVVAGRAPETPVDPPAATTPGRGPAPTVTQVPLSLLPSDRDETQYTSFYDFAVSPRYQSDGTVFASGLRAACAAPACGGLFRSTDRGVTWKRLLAIGYVGGRVLIPPSYPSDPRLFVVGPSSLQVSTDGGTSFVPLVGLPAVHGHISPDFDRDGRIMLGSSPGLEYRDELGAATPWDVPIASTLGAQPVFSPAFAHDRVRFLGLPGSVVRCVSSVCGTSLSGVSDDRQFLLTLSPGFAADGRVAAAAGNSVYLSRDGGVGFERVVPPFAVDVKALALDQQGRLFAAAFGVLPSGAQQGGLAVTSDEGRTWRRLGSGSPLEAGAVAVAPLPGGRILAAARGHGGLWCSVDDGATWHPRCPG
jgi:RNA polymerase sigma-70 factor (ECF subfamily)